MPEPIKPIAEANEDIALLHEAWQQAHATSGAVKEAARLASMAEDDAAYRLALALERSGFIEPTALVAWNMVLSVQDRELIVRPITPKPFS